jgi:hypothetical protein
VQIRTPPLFNYLLHSLSKAQLTQPLLSKRDSGERAKVRANKNESVNEFISHLRMGALSPKPRFLAKLTGNLKERNSMSRVLAVLVAVLVALLIAPFGEEDEKGTHG